MAFNKDQIDSLRATYDGINKVIDVHGSAYKRLINILDRCEIDELRSLESAGIKYVSALARNRLARRKAYT
jgi:hypothetical protein